MMKKKRRARAATAAKPPGRGEGESGRSKQVIVGARAAYRRAVKERDFPKNTCAASRHVFAMGAALMRGQMYPMWEEDKEHCAVSLLATVEALWKTRAKLEAHRMERGVAARIEHMDKMLRAVHASTDLQQARRRALKGLREEYDQAEARHHE